jgi:tRNA (guanine26-N2/guanine27-N2)-dimethyltransferase
MEKKDITLIKEGSATFYLHNIDKELVPSKAMNVFYNQRMEINRDITALAINAYRELYKQNELIIIDSMAASGVTSIRILKECKDVKKIYINDINPVAVKLIKKNIKLNKFHKTSIQIEITQEDANHLFSKIASNSCHDKQKKPNVISIDPFGTPNRFIDSAFKVIQKVDSLLCITATDTAVLFGIRPNACIRKYLAKPLHNEYCKEIGGRILLHFISRLANINKMGIVPLMTFYSGHFIRVFCVSFKNKKKISEFFKSYGYIIHCRNCGYRSSYGENIITQFIECPICNNKKSLDYAGPLWIDEIHDLKFINKLLEINESSSFKNKKRIEKLLNIITEEINMPVSYFNIHKICQTLKLNSIPKIREIIDMIKKKGYQASRTHFDFLSIKSNMDLVAIKNSLIEMQT